MRLERFPTLLGGEHKNLAWEDLNPDELLRAMHTSAVRAVDAIPLAEAQIVAAEELGDASEAERYTISLRVLQDMAEAEVGKGALPLQRVAVREAIRA